MIAALARLADEHRATPIIGRTRFQQAVPTTFGLKVAGWLAPLLRHRERLGELRPRLLVVQLGGAAGNLVAHRRPWGRRSWRRWRPSWGWAARPCPGTASATASASSPPGWRWSRARSASSGQDVLLLAQNEVGEVREAEGGGSSTMPQKSNPIRAEALVTLARRNATLLGGMHEAMLHAHERDGAAWQLEWAHPAGHGRGRGRGAGACGRARRAPWSSTPRGMRAIWTPRSGLPLAEAASFALAAHLPRAEAQKLVKEAAREARGSGQDLLEVVARKVEVPIDWHRLRADAEQPACSDLLIDRVLRTATSAMAPSSTAVASAGTRSSA